MITIAGGTGAVGQSLVQALLGKSAQVRVLTRDPQKAGGAFGDAGLEIAGIAFDDAATLQAAFTGSDRAFLSTGTSDWQVRDEIALIDAATQAGVPYPGEARSMTSQVRRP
jgi:NAD(P)H dehydrogenase (quinone)